MTGNFLSPIVVAPDHIPRCSSVRQDCCPAAYSGGALTQKKGEKGGNEGVIAYTTGHRRGCFVCAFGMLIRGGKSYGYKRN